MRAAVHGLHRVISRSAWLQTASHAHPDIPPYDPNEPIFFCVSPDAPTNPVLYWLGSYNHKALKFDLATADGPYRLDLGDTVYAPNVLDDPHGRKILWLWVQEKRKLGTYEYSGCMATPRIMLRHRNQLVQQPLPEIMDVRLPLPTTLRQGGSTEWQNVHLPEWTRVPLTGVSGRSLDMELSIKQGESLITGFVLHSWNEGGEGSAAVLFDWESRQLEVMFEALDPETMQFSLSAPNIRRIGGIIDHVHGERLHLRVLLDHSLLEVFTGNGQALTTRVYRGKAPTPEDGCSEDLGIDFLSLGGSATLERMAAWEMCSIWKKPDTEPQAELNSKLSGVIDKVDSLNLVSLESTTPPGIVAI